MQSSVIEICGANVSTCFLSCPASPKQTLAIKMPFLVLLIKYLKKYFTFEVQVIDDKNVKRRFRASNYQSNTRVKPFICTIPMKLDEGWNQIHFNLTDFTRRAYGTNYIETLRVQIHANCRIRRIYFTDQLISSKQIPAEYRAFNNQNDEQEEQQYQQQGMMGQQEMGMDGDMGMGGGDMQQVQQMEEQRQEQIEGGEVQEGENVHQEEERYEVVNEQRVNQEVVEGGEQQIQGEGEVEGEQQVQGEEVNEGAAAEEGEVQNVQNED
jgi:hypothetical protein